MLMNTRHPHRSHRITCRLLLLTIALLPAMPLMAQEYGIVDDVRIGTAAEGAQIRIDFTRAAQYIGHTPEVQGRQLFIDLRLVGPASTELQVPQRQTLRFRPTAEVPLTTVSYHEEGRSSARLELNFSAEVQFRVTSHSDYRGVTVTLAGDKAPPSQRKSAPEPVASPEVEKRAAELMAQARTAMVEERNFATAITLYQQVLDQPDNSRSREALELLGLARERLGQRAQAKALYDAYLERYPSGEGSERVRQRLMSLVTAALPEREQLRTGSTEDEAEWDLFGSFSQYYLRDVYRVDDGPTETTASAYSTDLDLIALRRKGGSDTRMRITAGHYYDLMTDEDGNEARVSALYAEHHNRDVGWWARGGRQSSSSDGALGRFDGLKLGYALGKQVEASVVAGYPVDSSRDSLNTDRSFTGVALDLGPFADSLEFSLYGLEQEVDSLVDRRAVGGELRYFRPELSLFGLVDYDLFFEELNIGMLLANWTLANELTLNATYDVRKAPTLTTSNALIGQTTGPVTAPVPVEDMETLRTLYSDDMIYQLARDRTAEIRTLTLGASRPVSERLRLSGDISVMNTSATVESGGVLAQPASGDDYFLNLQAIGTGVLNGDDISSLGLLLSDTTTAQSIGLYASSRLPVGRRWRYYPRLRVDHRTWKESNETQWSVAPLMRIEYEWGKAILEGELGGEWVTRELPDDDERTLGAYGSIGYRYEF
jgi:tetratricopeptide (TPR) repeat protein